MGAIRPRNSVITTCFTGAKRWVSPTQEFSEIRHYPGREPIGGGLGGYTRGGNQSEEGWEDIPGAGTNRRRDGRIYPGREPIGGGLGGYTRVRTLRT
eukprot:7944247-Pyramimonas_sp.AAC.1